MDPVANMREQVELARDLMDGRAGEDGSVEQACNVERLAELVLALHDWRTRGGFDPYTETSPFVKGYVRCALWSSTEEDGTPLDERFLPHDIHPDSMRAIVEDCNVFSRLMLSPIIAACGEVDGETAYTRESVGHDFWLTRNGHGTGFWDRTETVPEWARERMDKLSRCFGEANLYLGNDGYLHITP